LDWAQAQPAVPLWPGGPLPLDYVQGFVRTPGMGSYVLEKGHAMEIVDEVGRMFESLQWYPAEMPEGTTKEGHTYWTAYLSANSQYAAFESVSLLGDMTDAELETVRVRKGPHGLELFAPGQPRPVRQLIAIINSDGLVTWYPGQPTAAVNLAAATVKLG